jgi:hypothetical protein
LETKEKLLDLSWQDQADSLLHHPHPHLHYQKDDHGV